MPLETLETLVQRVWALKLRVALLALLILAAGAGATLAWPRQFLAEAMVAPSETTGIATSTLLSPSPAFSGLLDPRPSGNFAVYLGALRSAEAAAMLVAETALLAHLTERRTAWPGGAIRAALDLRIQADLDDARDWLERNLAVTQTLGAVTWTLALPHRDRDFALEALRRLHGFAEAKVRGDLAQLAQRRVAALESRLIREQDLYIRQSLYELLALQQRTGVVVAADEAVAARLVSAPMVELRASIPNRPLLLLLLLVTAPMAALALVGAAVLLGGSPPEALALRGHPGLRVEPAE
jgi:LPS O-antigen subunit length determinant protein (WzzB/FepE family)